MNFRNRNRTLWLLAALVSIHIVVTTGVFLATGAFPTALLLFTLAAYAVVFAAALYLFASARRAPLRRIVPEPMPEEVTTVVVQGPAKVVVDEASPERNAA